MDCDYANILCIIHESSTEVLNIAKCMNFGKWSSQWAWTSVLNVLNQCSRHLLVHHLYLACAEYSSSVPELYPPEIQPSPDSNFDFYMYKAVLDYHWFNSSLSNLHIYICIYIYVYIICVYIYRYIIQCIYIDIYIYPYPIIDELHLSQMCSVARSSAARPSGRPLWHLVLSGGKSTNLRIAMPLGWSLRKNLPVEKGIGSAAIGIGRTHEYIPEPSNIIKHMGVSNPSGYPNS